MIGNRSGHENSALTVIEQIEDLVRTYRNQVLKFGGAAQVQRGDIGPLFALAHELQFAFGAVEGDRRGGTDWDEVAGQYDLSKVP